MSSKSFAFGAVLKLFLIDATFNDLQVTWSSTFSRKYVRCSVCEGLFSFDGLGPHAFPGTRNRTAGRRRYNDKSVGAGLKGVGHRNVIRSAHFTMIG